jgi:hypothetical protein
MRPENFSMESDDWSSTLSYSLPGAHVNSGKIYSRQPVSLAGLFFQCLSRSKILILVIELSNRNLRF